ncbi:Elongator subunit elp4 [Quaeritorhiza haematococci]|nr:Elongator subunit elp4 [Quaeritorhiza haematococci]
MAVVDPFGGGASGTAAAEGDDDDDPEFLLNAGKPATRRVMGAVRSNPAAVDSLRSGVSATATNVGSNNAGSPADDRMKIAWRYQSMPKFSSSLTSSGTSTSFRKASGASDSKVPYCSVFDLTKHIEQDVLEKAEQVGVLLLIDPSRDENLGTAYGKVLELLQKKIEEGGFGNDKSASSGATTNTSVLRIAIHAVGTPYWGPADQFVCCFKITSLIIRRYIDRFWANVALTSITQIQILYRFLAKLRALVRNASACCFVTVPAHLYGDHYQVRSHHIIRRLEYLADAVVEIESFAGSPRQLHPAYTNPSPGTPPYHGLIHPIKLPSIRCLVPASYRSLSETQLRSLAFRVRRKRFAIETFHLPPEDGEDEPSGGGNQPAQKKGPRRMLGELGESGSGLGGSGSSSVDRLAKQMSRNVSIGYERGSGFGMGCGGGGGTGTNPLDF